MSTSTRARILDASSDLYLNGGDDDLTMRRVAERIGVSATAIYRHFPDRADLIEAVTDKAFGVFERFLLEGAAPRGGSRAHLRRFTRQYLEFVLQKPRLFEVLFLRRRANLRKYPEDFQRGESKTFELLHDVVGRAIAAGTLRDDLDAQTMALSIWTHVHGFAAQVWVGRFGDDHARIRPMYDRYVTHLLEGLAA